MPRDPKYSEDELLDEIKRLARKLGRTPTMSDMEDYGKYSSATYKYRFEGWSAAVDAAGLRPNE